MRVPRLRVVPFGRGMEPTMPAVFDNPRLRAAAAVNRRRSLGLRTRYSLAATAVVVMVMVVMVPFNEEGPRRIRRYVSCYKNEPPVFNKRI